MKDHLLIVNKLKAKISETLADYRHAPKEGMTVRHVSRWIDQFPIEDRTFVLEETARLLEMGYFTKKQYEKCITELAENEKNEKYFERAAFLSIQEDGTSQSELIESLNTECTEGIYTVSRHSSKARVDSFKEFIYFDDVCFSGRKVIDDLIWFVNDYDLREVEIFIYFLCSHTSAVWYVKETLKKSFQDRNIIINIGDGALRHVENRLKYNDRSGVFWPTQESVAIPTWVSDKAIYTGTYRNNFVPAKIFPDEARRNRFEAVLTSIGFRILSNSETVKKPLKPLGFSTFNGVGFGGTTFTYRNCPNNVPLVYWWGNYEPVGSEAVDCWYPLMKRIVYNR
ncbi:hypothetical protein P2G74_01405 [Cronobacter muytjensii]|uniref:phosphoribosyltransferase-like protein n=1 Tax=Cronobacter muytjensii TaxID=413501 RepID=UPI002DB8D7C4|nr:hypothetical protein [Cronobacter muytjensii]MEB8638629.1 hypothetical protein [Cronobacter muytjensii]